MLYIKVMFLLCKTVWITSRELLYVPIDGKHFELIYPLFLIL